MHNTKTRFFLLSISLFTISSICNASGFRVPEISTAGTATSNALVANGDLAGAMAYNPAIMTFQPDNTLVAGLTQLEYDLSYTRPAGGASFNNIGEDSFTIPNLYFKNNIDNDMAWGLAINAPFGLQTKWPAGTFAGFGGNPLAETELSEIKMVNVNPNMSFRLDENSSFAIGLDYYDVMDVNLNTYAVKITGSGQHHGYNVAFYQQTGKFSFGLSYRSQVKVQLNGSLNNTTPINALLTFPSIFQAGVRYQATDKLSVEFDVDRTAWNSFSSIVVRADATGSPVTASSNNWENSNAYRLGAVYDLSSKTRLMFGFTKDSTPQTANALFSARVPDADRNLYSIGVAHKIDGWTIEAAYMLVDQDTRTDTSTGTYPALDPNGTTVYNGTYEADVQLLSIGVVKSF